MCEGVIKLLKISKKLSSQTKIKKNANESIMVLNEKTLFFGISFFRSPKWTFINVLFSLFPDGI